MSGRIMISEDFSLQHLVWLAERDSIRGLQHGLMLTELWVI